MGEKSCSRSCLSLGLAEMALALYCCTCGAVASCRFFPLLCAKVLIFFDIQILFCTFASEFKTNSN